MAFEGDLSNLGLGDVLQAIAMSRQVGTFVLRGEDERRLACGPQGVALLSSKKSLSLKIGTVLVGSGKASQSDLDQALKIQARQKSMLLGQILIDTGACSADDLRTARRYLAAEEIFALFLWKQGQFEFQNGEPDMAGPFADLWFDVPSLAMEAARRIDEMPRILAAVPSGEVFVAVDGPNPHRESVLENRDLARLLDLTDGSRTAKDVQDDFYRGRFDTLKGLQTLLDAGLVRPVTKDEAIAAGRAAADERDYARAARLYERASVFDPADDVIRQAIADALRDSGEKRQAAEQHVRIGTGRLAAGKGLPAIESFRAATRLDASNAAAHEGLMRALAESGLVDEAADAATEAARLRLANGDYEGAGRVAEAGLSQRAGDPHLLVIFANSHHGLGRTAEALRLLDEAALALESRKGEDRRLVDVYRRIVQIDPARKDCARRIQELQEFELTRRRRLVRRAAVLAGVVVAAMIAIPFLAGPSAAAQIETARALFDARQYDEARTLLAALEGRTLSDDEEIEVRGLDAQIESFLRPTANTRMRDRFVERLAEAHRAGVDAILDADAHVAEGFAEILEGQDLLEGPDARKVEALGTAAFKKIRADWDGEVQVALSHAAGASQTTAARVTALRDRFTEDVWKREDLEVLHDLVAQSGRELGRTKAEDWEQVPALVDDIVRRTHAPKDASDRTTSANAAAIVDALRQVRADHDRATARARRKELKEGYKSAYANGSHFARDGRVEEALAHYERFLTQCEDLRRAEPFALYAPILTELFGGEMQLDQRIRTARDRLAAIVRASDEAQRSEAAGDVESAFRVRKHLLQANPDLDLSHRFQMPLRIGSAPPGASVFLLDGTRDGRELGRTPLVTTYDAVAGAKYQLRLPGYKTTEIVRRGAAEDSSGVEHVDLPKLARWTSKPAGMTEAAPTAAGGFVFTSSRSSVIRRIDAETGEETARFEPGLLDGFAAPAVVRGGRVFAVALDGKGFVLDPARLTKLASFEAGPVRAAPFPTARGVLVFDESGGARLYDEAGKSLWTKTLGRVRCDVTAAGEHVLFVTSDGELALVDPASGDVVRRRQLNGAVAWGPPSVSGGRAFLACETGEILCLDAATLEDAWTQRLDGPVRGRVSATGMRLVACTANGAIHLLDAETGAVLARSLVGGRIEDGLCDLPDGGFVVVTRKGNATRFDSKLQVVWKFDAGEEVSAPPRFVEGSVVLVTRTGVVIALAP